MITVTLKPKAHGPKSRRYWPFGKAAWPRVVAVFSFRHDAHLVPDLIANIEPIVDGWVSYDDRSNAALFSDEPTRRRLLLAAARDAGASWVLAVDPDERYERALAGRIARLTSAWGRVAWSFSLREMYSPTRYRVDGVWGRKAQVRLFPLHENQAYPDGAFHAPWMPIGYRIRHSGLNLYHLKMITPERREMRRRLYNSVDPDRTFQAIGYDYLVDDDGAAFEEIPSGREYDPPHKEDFGLWMPWIDGD